jgi:hypothetical protein
MGFLINSEVLDQDLGKGSDTMDTVLDLTAEIFAWRSMLGYR